MSEPITKLIAKLNDPENIDIEGEVEELISGAIIGCSQGLQGIGEFIFSAGIGNEEGSIPAVALHSLGNLITDLGAVIEHCEKMKVK